MVDALVRLRKVIMEQGSVFINVVLCVLKLDSLSVNTCRGPIQNIQITALWVSGRFDFGLLDTFPKRHETLDRQLCQVVNRSTSSTDPKIHQ